MRHTITDIWANTIARYSIILAGGAYLVFWTMETLRGFAMSSMGGAL